jgi:hypothetical protein
VSPLPPRLLLMHCSKSYRPPVKAPDLGLFQDQPAIVLVDEIPIVVGRRPSVASVRRLLGPGDSPFQPDIPKLLAEMVAQLGGDRTD